MSYDLEVRSDDDYSQSELRERVRAFLESQGAQAAGDPAFMFYDDPSKGHTIEIDLGYEGTSDPEMVNFVGFGVAYAFLSATGRKVLELAFAVAAHLGWRVYDPQAGRYLDAGDEAAAAASQASALHAVDRISDSPLRARSSFLSRILERLIRKAKFMLAIAVLAFGTIGAYVGSMV
jgi:hypothetical protein